MKFKNYSDLVDYVIKERINGTKDFSYLHVTKRARGEALHYCRILAEQMKHEKELLLVTPSDYYNSIYNLQQVYKIIMNL